MGEAGGWDGGARVGWWCEGGGRRKGEGRKGGRGEGRVVVAEWTILSGVESWSDDIDSFHPSAYGEWGARMWHLRGAGCVADGAVGKSGRRTVASKRDGLYNPPRTIAGDWVRKKERHSHITPVPLYLCPLSS